jgi:hypothetical protein
MSQGRIVHNVPVVPVEAERIMRQGSKPNGGDATRLRSREPGAEGGRQDNCFGIYRRLKVIAAFLDYQSHSSLKMSLNLGF